MARAVLRCPVNAEKTTMKIALLIIRLLLGLVFFVFGLNAFLHFIPAMLPSGLAGQFLSILFQSHYVLFIGAVQVAGGALLLVNRYVPLALILLGPVIVNILLYHLLLSHEGAVPAIVVAIFWGILAFRHRQYFASLFVQRTS
jgi:putative oxidoreductase